MTIPRDQPVLDELLVLQCQAGDMLALDELVRRWQPRLRRHALGLCADAAVADDLSQESWLAIVRGIRRLEDPGHFRAWAFRIVANKCADWLRWKGRDVGSRMDEEPEAPGSGGDGDNIERLQSALAKLSPERREILALRYLEDLSIGEIATVLQVPEGTVKSRLHHARDHLRQVLERGASGS